MHVHPDMLIVISLKNENYLTTDSTHYLREDAINCTDTDSQPHNNLNTQISHNIPRNFSI